MSERDSKFYSKRRTHDASTMQHGILRNKGVRTASSALSEGEIRNVPLDVLIENTNSLGYTISKRLILAVIVSDIEQQSLGELRHGIARLKQNKKEIHSRFKAEDIDDASVSENARDEDLAAITASRLLLFASPTHTPNVLNLYCLDKTNNTATYFLPPKVDGVLQEAIALLPNRNSLAGFEIERTEDGNSVTFYFYGDNRLTKKRIQLTQKEKDIKEARKSKRILIAVEGDIAGHTIRALETAQGLRMLGYEPDIVGNGYYMQHFVDAGFQPLYPPGVQENEERERIIAKARGEGKGGIAFWSYKTVKNRAREYEKIITDYLQNGIDLFLSDMNPIADIAAGHVQQEQGTTFPLISQTHDVRLHAERTLSTLRLKGIPVGEILDRINRSPLVNRLDPKNRRRLFIHLLFNQVADTIMGLPLSTYDHLYRRKRKKDKVPFRKPGRRFTDYLYARDGTLIFGLTDDTTNKKQHTIGLQADRGDARAEQNVLIDNIPEGDVFILNAQGSTYNKKAWNIIANALITLPHCFSVHATGKREDQQTPILVGTSDGNEQKGYKVGYVAGYRFSKTADLLIHHGGHGTISMWLLGAADRIGAERDTLEGMLDDSISDDEIINYVQQRKGVPRSIAVCNTFEQENNSLGLNEMGGDNVCRVINADKLVKSPDPLEQMRTLTVEMLTAPLDEKERQFWIDTVQKISIMNSPVHAALILERIIVNNAYTSVVNSTEQPNPYSTISKRQRRKLAALETPTIMASVVNKLRTKDKLSLDQAQEVLERAVSVLGNDFEGGTNASITDLISQGMESFVYSFHINEAEWVMKVGLPKGLAAGMFSPSIDAYADMMRWNRNVLQETFSQELPYLLPNPYFIVSPTELNYPTTVQIAPFIEQASSLTVVDRKRLVQERLQFDYLSRKLRKEKNVVPDLVNPGNLKIGIIDGELHLVLFDMGLQNLEAPTPLLNRLAYPAHRLSMRRDMRKLRRN